MAANSVTGTAYGRQAYAIAQFQAQRVGLQGDDVQDCAMEFVVKILGIEGTSTQPQTVTSAWLNRCAYNHACNFLRSVSRRRQREQSWTERFGADAERQEMARPAVTPGPRTLTMRKELWNQIGQAVKQLTPLQQELFIRHHFRNQSARELAVQFERTQHAMEQCLSNIRKRLVIILRNAGWTDDETRSLMRVSSSPETDRTRPR